METDISLLNYGLYHQAPGICHVQSFYQARALRVNSVIDRNNPFSVNGISITSSSEAGHAWQQTWYEESVEAFFPILPDNCFSLQFLFDQPGGTDRGEGGGAGAFT
jgi:hypothetical protein